MRAPGIAAIALGAVIALSGALGFAPRADAVPVDDPSTSSTVDGSTSSAAPSDTRATSGTETSPAPTTSPAATPTVTSTLSAEATESDTSGPTTTEPTTSGPTTSGPTDEGSRPSPQSLHDDHDGWPRWWYGHRHTPPTTNDYSATPIISFGDGAFTPARVRATFTATGGADAGTASLFEGGSAAVAGSCHWISGESCQSQPLSPGVWRGEVTQSWSDGHVSAPTVRYIVVPETPTIVVGGDDGFTISGTGDLDGDLVSVSLSDGTVVCEATVSDGAWSCDGVTAPSDTGSYAYRALETAGDACTAGESPFPCSLYQGGSQSAFSATAVYVVAPDEQPSGTPTPTPSETPTPTPATKPATKPGSISLSTLATWLFTVTGVDLGNVHPGDHFVVSGTDLPTGAIISGELHSVAVPVGTTTVGDDGSFSLPITVPQDFAPGAHELVMTMISPDGVSISSEQPLTVTARAASSGSASDSTTEEAPTATGSGSEGGNALPGGEEAVSTNILTHGLNSIADVLQHPEKVPAAIEIGLVLLIFAVLPSHLLNATLAEQYEKLARRRLRRRVTAPGWWLRLMALLHRAPVLAGVALTTVTALLFGFADPRFGFTLVSVRLFLGLAIALAVVTYFVNVVVGRIMRSRWQVDVEVSLRPLGLILTVVGVVISRLLDFSPGFLIGLVLGLVIVEKSAAKQAWRAVLLRTSILLGLALLAWLAFSLFDSKEEGGTFLTELAVETLVAITTEAVVALMVELLPLKLLEGEKLYQHSKVVWGALYLLAIFIFVVAVVPWEGNWATLGSSLWAWIGIVVGYGIVATGIYLYFRIRSHEEPEEVEDGDLVAVGGEQE